MTLSAVPRPAAPSAPASAGAPAADRPGPSWPAQDPAGADRSISWSGLIEQPAPGAGPHRIRAVSACTADTGRHDPFDFTGTGALPALRSVVPVSSAEPSPEGADDLPGADPFSDTTPVGGLHKFDLGMVPASVTPPRSSRRAAWFAVASSGAAFGGLLLVATTLVGPTTSIEGLQLPGMPRATHFPAPAPERVIAGPSAPAEPSPTSAPGHPPRPAGAPLPPPFPHLPPAPAERPAAVAAPESSAAPAPAPEPPGAAAPEQSSTVPSPSPSISYRGELLTLTDPRTVAARSGNYFAAVRGGDLRAAYAMTTGRLHDGGFAAFAAPYRDAASIEVLDVSASSSSTVTTLRITGADGAVSQQQRRLRFTSGDDPRIYADDAVT